MAEEGQEVTFSSEKEKADAIDGFDMATGKEEDLDAMMEAKIVEKVEESEVKETETPEPEQKTEKPATPPEPEEKKPEAAAAEQNAPEEWGVKKTELPDDSTGEKYKTPGAVFKAFGEQKSFINRQADHIKAMNEQHEAELAELRNKPAVAPVETPKPDKPVVDENVADQVKIVQAEWEKEVTEDPYSEKTTKARTQLDNLILKDNQSTREAVQKVDANYQTFAKSQEQIEVSNKNKQSLARDYKEIDELGGNKEYGEYKLSKPSKEAEEDYILWGGSVAMQYYGKKAQNMQEVHHALAVLDNKSPDLVQKCELAQIPSLPTDDIAAYLKACEALDYRDGWRTDATGKRFQVTRWDARSQKDIPDRYPSLSAAIEDKRVQTGYYKAQKVEAYDKGSKDALNAAAKRDHNELDSEDGTLIEDNLTVEQMAKELDSLSPIPANEKRINELTEKLELVVNQQRG